jgi:hypothetical protein
MNLLFIAKEGVDLYETLMDSETSRIILRFYAPQRHPCGVRVVASSLGIGLSLVSELRWYVRRYMTEVLFELQDGIYGTYALSREVYERDIRLEEEGIQRSVYAIKGGWVDRRVCRGEEAGGRSREDPAGPDEVLEVWSLQEEGPVMVEEDLSDRTDENPLCKGM